MSQVTSICHVESAVRNDSRVEGCEEKVADAGCYLFIENFRCRAGFSSLTSRVRSAPKSRSKLGLHQFQALESWFLRPIQYDMRTVFVMGKSSKHSMQATSGIRGADDGLGERR